MPEKRFLGLLARWIGTAFFTTLIVATVAIYQAKDNFTSAHKAAYNTIMLVLALFLGLNFFVITVYGGRDIGIQLMPQIRKLSKS